MTKALHVCRHMAAAGWRVVLVETHKYWHVGARFSGSVHAFHTVPMPEDHPEAYVNALLGAAQHCMLNKASHLVFGSKESLGPVLSTS
jgi:hypothetical protein